ncbi:MAG: HNH endonuclease [Chloroflexi bacterium]|nr:HNH endonuclease [Chloroflexota bacterium]
MPRHHKSELLNRIVDAVVESGWSITYLTGIKVHPFRLVVYKDNESYSVRVYVWHMTHGGGRARPQNEYRIQVTGTQAFSQTGGEKTLILGWWAEGEVFAGFDVRKHLGPLGKSPSIQIREEYLRQAYINGFAPCDRGNGEVAIAFRPDFFVEYVRNLEALHNFGQFAPDVMALRALSENPAINDEQIDVKDETRRRAVVAVRRALRDISFRRRVLTAYRFRCAVCGVQLRLVDAAHIIPVSNEKSTDETQNGLALCALHHRAYDQALIWVQEDYTVALNELQLKDLARTRQDQGLGEFSQNLRTLILLPPAVADRPHVEYIRIANKLRGFSG